MKLAAGGGGVVAHFKDNLGHPGEREEKMEGCKLEQWSEAYRLQASASLVHASLARA